MDEQLGEGTQGAEEVLGEDETLKADDTEGEGVLEGSILDIFESEGSENEALKGLADGLENVDVLELIEHCYTVLEQFEAQNS